MLVTGFLQWWYHRGWTDFIKKLKQTFHGLEDGLSISLLLKTLTAPYKQISAYGGGRDSFQAQISDFFDRLLSRAIGTVLRLTIIFVGIIALFLDIVFSGIAIILWPLLPALPFVGIILAIAGVTF